MFIKKDNLVIRSATFDDADILTNWWNDGAIMAHAGFPNGLGQSVEETINQIKQNEIKLSQICIIEVNSNKVGEGGFRIGKNFAEIGIKICDTSYQNHGYGKELLKMLIDYLFTDEKLNSNVKIDKIKLDTNNNNKRAQHVYEGLGFKKVATNIGAFENQLGELQTSVDYEMSLDDYKKVCLN